MVIKSLPFTALVSPKLEEVEELIRDSLESPSGALQEKVDHIRQAGGKRLRPLLVVLSAELFRGLDGRPGDNGTLKTAAAAELIHTASLVHDDIIDGASRRRGKLALHRRWDDRSATLVGDYLLSRAFDLLCSVEQRESLLPLMARSVQLLCRGEVRQLGKSFDWSISEQEYYRCNYLKTSQFLAACCEAGGRLAPAAAVQLRALREYGFNLGQAFQVVDDILDYSGVPGALGKPVGSDLNQGVVTLPLIYLLSKNKRYRSFLSAATAGRESLRPALQVHIRQAVQTGGGLQYASRRARQAGAAALAALQALPDVPARQLLEQIVEEVTGRLPSVS